MYEHIYIYIYVSVLLVLSHVLPQVHLVMAPKKAAYTVECLNGFGADAVEAAFASLSQESAAALEHLSCQYSFSNLVCKF